MASITAIPSEFKPVLLARFASLPEEEWLKFCKHPDQWMHWQECKQRFHKLEMILRAYFGGQAFPFPDASPSDREFMQRSADRWLLLYSLLFHAWSAIVKAAEAEYKKIEKKGLQPQPFPATPGDMLLEILRRRAIFEFWECLEDATPEQGRFSPSSSQKLYQEYRKLIALADSGKPLTPEQKKRVKQFNKKVLRINPPIESYSYQLFCLSVCEKLAKRDRFLCEKLKAWKGNEAEIESEVMRFTHPQKCKASYQWVNGQKVLTCS